MSFGVLVRSAKIDSDGVVGVVAVVMFVTDVIVASAAGVVVSISAMPDAIAAWTCYRCQPATRAPRPDRSLEHPCLS